MTVRLQMSIEYAGKVLHRRDNGITLIEDQSNTFSERMKGWGWVNAQLTTFHDHLVYFDSPAASIELHFDGTHVRFTVLTEALTAAIAVLSRVSDEKAFEAAWAKVKSQLAVFDAMIPTEMVAAAIAEDAAVLAEAHPIFYKP